MSDKSRAGGWVRKRSSRTLKGAGNGSSSMLLDGFARSHRGDKRIAGPYWCQMSSNDVWKGGSDAPLHMHLGGARGSLISSIILSGIV